MNALEKEVAHILLSQKLTIAVAESCTGGLIASRLTNISGSSAFFERGAVTYSNLSKTEMLGVPKEVIETYGAVSEQTAKAMAEGIRTRSRTDLGLSVTGIAGPTGGTPGKPVGTVFIALASDKGTECQQHFFQGDRSAIRWEVSETALRWIRDYCQKSA
ncbi:MAG: CinA family protein [Deltaproteobacteria bacterium]|nr:CinA family protein [Deltaproteobacteria bacterium]